MPRQNEWIKFIKLYSKENSIPYKKCITDPACKKAYQAQKNNPEEIPPRATSSRLSEVNSEIKKLQNEKRRLTRDKGKPKMKGGKKIPAEFLGEIVKQGDYLRKKKRLTEVQGYFPDMTLSTKWVTVWNNPETKHTIVYHRGSSDIYDAWVDAKLFKNQAEGTDRFKESKRIQLAAEDKYGAKNIITAGTSLGAWLAQSVGQNSQSVIAVSKPSPPAGILKGIKPSDKQVDINTTLDPISILKRFDRGKNDILLKSESIFDPLTNHLGQNVLAHKDIPPMIGLGRLKAKDLKTLCKILRKGHAREYPITKIGKQDLRSLAEKLRERKLSSVTQKKYEDFLEAHSSELNKKVRKRK